MLGSTLPMTELPANPKSPREARKFVSRTLHQWDLEEVVDVAELLTSEVVTNALLHAGSPVRLVIALDDRTLRIEAHDENSTTPVIRPMNSQASSGRGLALIDALAEEWGTRLEPDGKVVWFSIRI